MALINCPECGAKISNRAKKCIHCGETIDISKLELINIDSFDTFNLINSKNGKLVKIIPPHSSVIILDPDDSYVLVVVGVNLPSVEFRIPPSLYNKFELSIEQKLLKKIRIVVKNETNDYI